MGLSTAPALLVHGTKPNRRKQAGAQTLGLSCHRGVGDRHTLVGQRTLDQQVTLNREGGTSYTLKMTMIDTVILAGVFGVQLTDWYITRLPCARLQGGFHLQNHTLLPPHPAVSLEVFATPGI